MHALARHQGPAPWSVQTNAQLQHAMAHAQALGLELSLAREPGLKDVGTHNWHMSGSCPDTEVVFSLHQL